MGLNLKSPGPAFVVILAVCLSLAYLIQAMGQLGPDVAWINYGVGRLLQGDKLYRDVIEVNPPFIYQLSLPPIWLAHQIGGGEASLYRIWVLLFAALSGLAGYAILVRSSPQQIGTHFMAVAAHLVLITVLIGESFGQREHFLFMLLAPYIFLGVTRIEGRPVAPLLAVCAGAAAALALGLKPHYAVVFVLLEAVQWRWADAGLYRPLRPETLAVFLSGLFLLLDVLIAYPAFLSEIVPLARRAYLPFMHETAQVIWSQFLSLLVLVCAYATAGTRVRAGPPFWVLLAAGLASICAAMLQYRGFRYQMLPGLFFLLTASTFLLGRIEQAKSWLVITVSAGALVTLLDFNKPWAFPLTSPFVTPGSSIAVLSVNIADAFPAVPALGLKWVLHVPSLWFMPFIDSVDMAAAAGQDLASSDISLAHSLRRDTVYELVSSKPSYILLQKYSADMFPRPVNHLAVLSMDERFPAFFSRYAKVWQNAEFELYALKPDG